MERLVINVMYKYFEDNGMLTSYNPGFKELDSTVNQLIHIINTIYIGIDDHMDICMIFQNVSQAFDKMYYDGLIFKLKQLAINGHNIESDIYIFADDTSLMWPIVNPAVNFGTLNSDLKKLFRWAHQWRAAFNAAKQNT